MNCKNFFAVFFLLVSACTAYNIETNETEFIYKKNFTNKGFTLVYSEDLYKNKIISSPNRIFALPSNKDVSILVEQKKTLDEDYKELSIKFDKLQISKKNKRKFLFRESFRARNQICDK